jgi:putative spermidine/putrescine transport system permease protein
MSVAEPVRKNMGGAKRPPFRFRWNWLGVMPFLLFAGALLVLPTIVLGARSLTGPDGATTFENYGNMATPVVIDSFRLSIKISLITALVGGMFGFLLAWSMVLGGLPRPVRSLLSTFSGVASNFAGVPLAAAFIATVGRVGLFTILLKAAGFDIYKVGFDLYSFIGISVVYLYFQFPLMVLVITPSIEGLKKEWREASENLGASTYQYWRHIALPVLMPSILGAMILLFGNAFGAHATAFALTGGNLRLATILIGQQISGDVLQNPGLGYAVAMGMVAVMAVSIGIYSILQRRSERWLA